MPGRSARVEVFTESVIREMTRLAQRHGALNLAQGFPDFDPPEEVVEAAVRALRGGMNQYAITWGTRTLREAIAEKLAWYNAIVVDPERHVTVTCGATEAMIAALLALVDPGDEVVVFEPFYENYGPDALLSGATLRVVTLDLSDEACAFDPDALRRAFSPKTKAIVVNTPHNPTGKVFSRDELGQIADLCQRHDAFAVTDEVYEHILYDGAVHTSIASLPGMAERTITINSVSKTYAATGWRVGWAVTADERVAEGIRRAHDFLTVGAPAPLQEAAAAALRLPREYYRRMADGYRRRRDSFLPHLDAAGFRILRPAGAYYVMADISGFGRGDDVAFARYLVEHVGVATVPGSSFFHRREDGAQYVRFAFPKSEATLAEVGRRLRDGLGGGAGG